MDFFQVTVVLDTEIIIGRRTTLDALLAGVLFKRYNDPERAIAEVPLGKRHGVPQASQALYETLHGHRLGEVQVGQYFARDLINNEAVQETLTKLPARVEVGRGDFQNVINRYVTIPTPRLFFLASGDIDAVTAIMAEVKFIGSQRKAGYGKVADFEVFKVETENQNFGIIGSGSVLRPVPVRLQHHFPSVEHAVLRETWHNPYVPVFPSSIVEDCMVPPFMTGEGFSVDEVEQFYHA